MMRLLRKLVPILLLVFVAFILYYYRYAKLSYLSVDMSKFVFKDSDQACQQPRLKLYPNERFRQFFDIVTKTPECDEEDWTYTENGTVRFSTNAVKKYGAFTCGVRVVVRQSDSRSTLGPMRTVKDGHRLDTDFCYVECRSGHSIIGSRYRNYHAAIVRKPTPKVQMGPKSLDMNILILSFDSVSRLTWQRKLPKTYGYLVENLDSVSLKGYNIVGDGTPAALLPILTGKREEELPNADRGHDADAKPVDGHPFFWKKVSKLGYVTQFAEDGAIYSTFNYRMMGFDNQPTDHYMRPFYLMIENGNMNGLLPFNLPDSYCLGSKLRHNLMLDWIRDLYVAYPDRPKFTFAHHNQLSHHNNALELADEDLRRFLQRMNEDGYLDKTFLIIMSDHGARYEHLRNTEQGNLEERNPFFSIRPPPWFRTRYPEQYAALVENSQRLTTPFDIHETLLSLLDFQPPEMGSLKFRAMSLFSRVPKQRTCQHAAISPHWCACLQRTNLDKESRIVRRCVEEFTKFLNRKLPSKYCHMLRVTIIHRAFKFETNPSFGRDKIREQEEERYLQLSVTMQPGGGRFEFTAKHSERDDTVRINGQSISRTNLYGGISACVADTYPKLRPYCVCRDVVIPS